MRALTITAFLLLLTGSLCFAGGRVDIYIHHDHDSDYVREYQNFNNEIRNLAIELRRKNYQLKVQRLPEPRNLDRFIQNEQRRIKY